MTIEEFMENKGIKNRKTIEEWIRKGYIPKASIKDNFIPNSARVPYTKARAKNSKSIYVSIVKASSKLQHVVPSMYKICDDEFDGYINRLIEARLIDKRVSDGVTYYDATIDADKINEKFVLTVIEKASKGVTEAIIAAIP